MCHLLRKMVGVAILCPMLPKMAEVVGFPRCTPLLPNIVEMRGGGPDVPPYT